MMTTYRRNLLAALGLVHIAVDGSPTFAADPTAAAKPNADKILREASATLAAARQFSFKAHRFMDASLLVGRDVP